ncbi:uncharacterized protein EKO05_0007091 [Ascochyta rabiei]|nr:uncharacterized protein EKO05_0007091 [Ascochyta rabiei]UPX16703.1 hypothetical protein EKO05_0007091 [Ascochyta rabiei]
MEDLDSSDIEFDAPPRNPFHNAGKASVMAMLDHALDDRIASKRQVKQLTFAKGTPNTQYIHALWWNRFAEFRLNTLNKGANDLPKSEELERFFTTIVSRVKPRTNQVPAYSWLKSGVGFTIESCVFYHDKFTLSPHERLRISSLIDSLLQQGKVTQDPSWERSWAGVVVVRKLIHSLVTQAFQYGTMTWDIVLAKCLSIVLVSALGARAGDVTVAPRDQHTLPYLVYKDVIIKMKEGSTIDDLVAVVTLRNEKGDKADPKKNRIVLLKALPSPRDSLVCPIKLLLALALRLGNVPETCIEDLIKNTARRKNRTVLWSFPERSVHCAFGANGAAVTIDKAAGNHQLTQTMAQATLAAGLLTRLHAHDLRRGAARDTAHLEGKAKGIANKQATMVLGHNASSANRPLTAHYVGAHDDDMWTKRVDRNYVDSVYETPEAENPYQRKFQILKPQDVSEECLAKGLDSGVRKDRAKASKLLEKRRQADWADQENRKRHMSHANEENVSQPPPAGIVPDSHTLDENRSTEQIAAGDFIDPQLLQQSGQLCNVMIGAKGAVTNSRVEDLLFDSVQGLASSASEFGESDTLGIVRQLSAINISCNQILSGWGKTVALAKERTLSLIEGNSRDKVTSYVYACTNQLYGCSYGNVLRIEVSRHEQVCPITSAAAYDELVQKEATKTFKCTTGDCTKSFDTVGKLNSHVKEIHQYPRPCAKGCDGMFASRQEYNMHMESHSSFTPTQCLVPDCKNTNTYKRAQIYRKHVRNAHNIHGKDIDQHMPYKKKANFEPTQCGVGGCPSRATFKLPNQYKAHLREKHLMAEDEIERCFS